MIKNNWALFCRLAFFLVLVFPVTGTAAEDASPNKSPESTKSTPRRESPRSNQDELKQQVQILEAQLQVMKDYQNSLLDTVYWSLASILMIVMFLLGYGWFTNYRQYERDKESMKTALANHVEQETKALAKSMNALAEKTSQELEKTVTQRIELVDKSLKGTTNTLERRLFQLEWNSLTNKMTTNTSPSLALSDAMKLLGVCIDKKHDEISNVLHFMLKKIGEGGKFTASEITKVNEMLDKLPTQFGTLAQKLKSKLVASDIHSSGGFS